MTRQATRQAVPLKLRVGRNIATAREDKGLTQRRLAAVLGTEGFAVSRWERGKVTPSDAYFAKLAKALDRDIAWFYADHTAEPATDAA